MVQKPGETVVKAPSLRIILLRDFDDDDDDDENFLYTSLVLALSEEKVSQPFEVRIYAFVAVHWIPIQGFSKNHETFVFKFQLS